MPDSLKPTLKGGGVKVVQLIKGHGRQPWHLCLVSANGQVLAVSEGYFSKWNARRAARKNFAGVELVEVKSV